MKKIVFLILLLTVWGFGADDTVTVCPSGCDYSQLRIAIYSESCDLTTLAGKKVFEITGDWSTVPYDSLTVIIHVDSFTNPTSEYCIVAYTDEQARHPGYWDSDKYILKVPGRSIDNQVDYTIIDGLQVEESYTGASGNEGIRINSVCSTATVKNCIVRKTGTATASQYGIYTNSTSGTYYIYNNLVYDFMGSGASDRGIHMQAADNSGFVYNNTVCNSKTGIHSYSTYDCVAKNNIIWGCENPVNATTFGDSTSWNATDSSSLDYTVGVGGGNDSTNAEFSFTNSGGDNWHLEVPFAGIDLSDDPHLQFTTDIDGDTRTEPWDRGMDEYMPSGVKRVKLRK